MARTAAIALLAAFVASRVALLVSSYDANQNGEEPVFLFSATELARDGFAGLFDHQDDLNHGASVLLLLLAVPWVTLLGTSLLTLKGLAILWSALTLCVLVAVSWRYFSPRAGLLLGLFYLTLSPSIARLNVTLVGSHPEALLACFLALGAYLAWAGRAERGEIGTARGALALGFCSGFALWMSYLSATIVAPLLAVRVVYERSGKNLLALAVGLVTGALPWMVQNLWLRPHGALLWTEHVGVDDAVLGLGSPPLLRDLVASFGYPEPVGVLVLALCLAALVVLATALRRASWRSRLGLGSLAIVPLVVGPVLGLGLLAWAERPAFPNEGYYHYRYFVLLQGALFLPLAIVADRCLMIARQPTAIALVVLVSTGVAAQAGLQGAGNGYEASLERDRARGCLIFGLAEWQRASSPERALQRLGALSGPRCAERALGALGWMMVREAIVKRDPGEITRLLAMVETPDERRDICEGARFWLRATRDTVASDARELAVRRLERACAGLTAQGRSRP